MTEAMKEKTRRLERIVKGKNAAKTDTFHFSEVRKMIELALAEDREVCARLCDREVYPLLVRSNTDFMAGIAHGAKACAHRIRYSCTTSGQDVINKVVQA